MHRDKDLLIGGSGSNGHHDRIENSGEIIVQSLCSNKLFSAVHSKAVILLIYFHAPVRWCFVNMSRTIFVHKADRTDTRLASCDISF